MTIAEYAAACGRHPQTVRRWVHAGLVTARPNGNTWDVSGPPPSKAAIRSEVEFRKRAELLAGELEKRGHHDAAILLRAIGRV